MLSAEELRAEARKHEEIARKYRDLADWLEQTRPGSGQIPDRAQKTDSSRESIHAYREYDRYSSRDSSRDSGADSGSGYSASSREFLHRELLRIGPSTAREIHNITGMPLATIYSALQDSRLFRKRGLHYQAIAKRRSSKDSSQQPEDV